MKIKQSKKIRLSLCLLLLSTSIYSHAKDSPQDYFSYDFDGYLMLDRDEFDDIYLEQNRDIDTETRLRRARLSMKFKLGDHWKSKLQIDAIDEIELKDAYISYRGFQPFNITLGKQKEPFGLENLSSSRKLALSERAMVSEAFGPGRSNGLALDGDIKTLYWQVGYYLDDTNDDINALTGRASWAAWQNDTSLVHLGAAFSERNLGNEEFRINETLEVYSADSLIEGESLIANSASLRGLEFIGQYNQFTTTAEWQTLDLSANTGQSYEYQGGYLQLSYIFSDTPRRYKNGELDGVEGNNIWETTFRFSQLDLIEEDNSAQALSFGLNYYPKKNVKLMASIVHAKYQEALSESEFGQAFKLRAQFEF